jgi:signal transduction histidine kinase
VRLRADDREVRFEVTDDGAALSGIAEGALGPGGAGGGYGLAGIEERARLLGGEARAGASARGGFEVSITFPASRLT